MARIDLSNDCAPDAATAAQYLTAIHRSQAVVEFDLNGVVLAANGNFLKLLGYDEAEVVGKHHRLFCTPAQGNSEDYRRFWAELKAGEFRSGEFQRLGKGGREIWISATYNPIVGEDGRVTRVVKFANDVSETKRQCADLAGKVTAINRAQGVIEFSLEGTVLSANENFLNLLGYTLREVQGKHHRIFCLPELVKSREYSDFWARLSRGEFHSGRFLRIGKFDQRIWIQATYNPVFDCEGRVSKIVKFATDITALVEREEDIRVKADTMSLTVQQLLAAIESIATCAHESSDLANQNQAEAQAGSAALEELMSAMASIRKASDEINEIVNVINDIAGQTNLLAFNAAIEAARAGSHGLGFSVVAEEVRRLAEKSTSATRDIGQLIKSSVERVQHGHEVSRRAVESFKTIHAGVARTTTSIAAIDEATEEQSRAARRVAELIQQLTQASAGRARERSRELAGV